MDRRGFLRATGGALGAAVGALTLKRGIGPPEAERGVQGQQVGENATLSAVPSDVRYAGYGLWVDAHGHEVGTVGGSHHARDVFTVAPMTMTLVAGPDPDTYVYIAYSATGEAAVRPGPFVAPFTEVSGMAIPRESFPEYDPANGVVPLDRSLMADDSLPMIRAAYLHALGQRQPDRPLDGNHLSVRFMPREMIRVKPYLDGAFVNHVTESYDGPNGWVVQAITDEKGDVVTLGGKLRYRLVTGNVQHWVDTVPVWPGDYTVMLLR